MEKTDIHPDEVLNALLEKGYKSNKVANLKAVHAICTEQFNAQNHALRDFTLASIGRLCEAKGVIKGRALYNASSADYVALINAWAAFSGPSSVKPPKREPAVSSSHAYLMRIEDPAIRSIMQAAIQERDKLKQQLNILKSQTHVVINKRPLGATIAQSSGNIALLEVSARLTDSERDALRKAVSTDFLADQEWTVGSDGEVMSNGRMLFDPGFIGAIRKVLAE
jgi:hypothetical protein